jgi:hypothetical protein
MDTNPYLPHLDRLIRRGRELRHTLTPDAAERSTTAAVRIWQQDCATLVNQLAGGSKAHWLSRAYSQALLVRSSAGRAVEEANLADIVDRIIDVLGRAVAALSQADAPEVATSSSEAAPPPRRFEFVHNAQLRPILERAFADSRRAFDDGDFRQALILSCGVLETVITDALTHRDDTGRAPSEEAIAEWSFETRIASAERAGLILGGCARLPPVARAYRDLTDVDGQFRPDVAVSGRDAQLARQVLMVVLRDLDPGR